MERTDRREPPAARSAFLSGVFLLSLSTVIVKVTGLITKIPMLRLLGAEGMGYYNTAYEIYAFLFVLSTAGLPTALSILISEGRGDSARILRVTRRLFGVIGLLGTAFLWFGAERLAALMGNAGAAPSIRAVAPAVLWICLASVIRGYCQGRRDMKPTAVSQVLESLGKLVIGLLLAGCARNAALPLTQVAAAGAWGLSGGTLLSLIYLQWCLWRYKARERRKGDFGVRERAGAKRPAQRILRRLLAIAVPITLSSGVITLTRLLDMILILRRLQANGYTEAAVNMLYGAYSTLAVPLYALLPAMVSAVALPLVPGITHAREKGDAQTEREIVESSFRLTLMIALPAGLGLSAFAHPILTLLFGQDSAVFSAAPLLVALGASVPAACLMTVTGAMLQAYRRPHLPLVSMLLGSAVKLVAAWFLLGETEAGMLGAPLSTFLCSLAVVALDLAFLHPLLPREHHLSVSCRRILAASVTAVGGICLAWRALSHRLSLPRWAVIPAVCLCAAVYALLLLRMGALRKEDVMRLKNGERLWVGLKRLGCLPNRENVVDTHEKIG